MGKDTEVSKGKDTASEEKAVEEVQHPINSIAFLNLAERVEKLEGYMEKILRVIDIKDEAVKIPPKSNYNPDYLPKTGGSPKTMKDLPPRQG